jgi:hypothetical protein
MSKRPNLAAVAAAAGSTRRSEASSFPSTEAPSETSATDKNQNTSPQMAKSHSFAVTGPFRRMWRGSFAASRSSARQLFRTLWLRR